MLSVENLVTGYDRDAVIRGVSFEVQRRQIMTVLGHNGAGKSSVVRAVIGLLPVWDGTIRLDGRDVTRTGATIRVKSGIGISFQEDSVFPTMTVRRNMELGGYTIAKDKQLFADQMENVVSLFPRLRERFSQLAYTLSGGERRMLSIAMALMSNPKLLLLDEPSTGLSPAITEQVMETITTIRDSLGKSVLLVEQNVQQALACSDRVIVLKTGTIVYAGTSRRTQHGSNRTHQYVLTARYILFTHA